MRTYRSFAKVFFWLLIRHLCWCRRMNGLVSSHKLNISNCELAYDTLNTCGLVFGGRLAAMRISMNAFNCVCVISLL